MRKVEREKSREGKEDCKDGEHCEEFKQIGEAGLLQHLRDGWTIAQKLSDGEVIVKRA